MKDIIEIWTDGSCKKNPGPGGYGVLIVENNNIISAYNEECDNTTNNREELKAIIYALNYVTQFPNKDFIIYSDSSYCVNIANDWIYTWAKNNWLNSKKQEVENLDLIKTIYNYLNIKFLNCQVVKVKGHNDILYNELADCLATNNLKKFIKITKDNFIENEDILILREKIDKK